MSYVFKKGKEARAYVEQQNNDYSKQLAKIKSGESILVKLASDDDYVLYFAHSAFGSFKTTLCHDKAGKGKDLYCKASDLLYKDYFKKVDELKAQGMSDKEAKKAAEDIRQQAYTLKAKGRYLMAFFSVDTGEQILVDVTENQGNGIIDAIDKYASKKDKVAFELSKVGSGTKTAFSLMPVLDMDEDLTDKQRENFESLKGKSIDEDAYEKVFQFRDEAGQIEDLKEFGFDLSRLGVDASKVDEEVQKVDDVDENPESQF